MRIANNGISQGIVFRRAVDPGKLEYLINLSGLVLDNQSGIMYHQCIGRT